MGRWCVMGVVPCWLSQALCLPILAVPQGRFFSLFSPQGWVSLASVWSWPLCFLLKLLLKIGGFSDHLPRSLLLCVVAFSFIWFYCSRATEEPVNIPIFNIFFILMFHHLVFTVLLPGFCQSGSQPCVCVCVCVRVCACMRARMRVLTQSCLTLATPWIVVQWAPLAMKFSRQESWRGLPLPTPKDLNLFGVIQSLSCVQLFVTSWTTAHQASLSFTISWNSLKYMSIESVMLSNHLVLCCPPSPFAFSLCQYQGLFQWVDSLHQPRHILHSLGSFCQEPWPCPQIMNSESPLGPLVCF